MKALSEFLGDIFSDVPERHALYHWRDQPDADERWARMAEHAGMRLISNIRSIMAIYADKNDRVASLEREHLLLVDGTLITVNPVAARVPGWTMHLATPAVWARLRHLCFPMAKYTYEEALAHLGLFSLKDAALLQTPPASLHHEAMLLAKGIPTGNPNGVATNQEAMSIMPERWMQQSGVIPQRVSEEGIHLYMVNPEDAMTIAQVTMMTQTPKVFPILMTAEDAALFWHRREADQVLSNLFDPLMTTT